MADGFDGFEALTGRKFLVDHETGTSISNIIRSFLLGSAYIMRKKQLVEDAEVAEQAAADAPAAAAAAHGAQGQGAQATPAVSIPGAPSTPAKGHAAACDLTDAVGPDGVSPANGAYFGTKTPLVLKKHRERAARSPVASPRASLAGRERKPATEMNTRAVRDRGIVDVAVEQRGHMPGGDYNVQLGEPEPASSLVQVQEVELPTKDALLDASFTPEQRGHMPGGTENVFDPPAAPAATQSQGTRGTRGNNGEQVVVEGEQVQVQESSWDFLRHHVVQHDWDFIKEAIYLAKHEHMSDVDRFKGDLMRRIQAGVSTAPTPARTPTPAPTPGLTAGGPGAAGAAAAGGLTGMRGEGNVGMPCDDKCKLEIDQLDNDLAIVSPLVDGRLRDMSGMDGL